MPRRRPQMVGCMVGSPAGTMAVVLALLLVVWATRGSVRWLGLALLRWGDAQIQIWVSGIAVVALGASCGTGELPSESSVLLRLR